MSKKFPGALMKVSVVAAVIIVVVMLGRGPDLFRIAMPWLGDRTANMTRFAVIAGNVQTVSFDVQPHDYAPLVIQKGIPVRLILRVTTANLNGCNNTIVIPEYKIRKKLQPGENMIEFTPRETGDIPYSCRMGMIKSKIRVVAALPEIKGRALNH